MLELMKAIDDYLISQGEPNAAGNEDFFPGDTEEEVMCRHDPGPLVKKQYLDGSKLLEFNFSYFKKSSNPITARQALEEIVEALSLDNFSELLGLQDGRLEVTARPTPVGEGEDGTVTYTSSYKLVYFQEV